MIDLGKASIEQLAAIVRSGGVQLGEVPRVKRGAVEEFIATLETEERKEKKKTKKRSKKSASKK